MGKSQPVYKIGVRKGKPGGAGSPAAFHGVQGGPHSFPWGTGPSAGPSRLGGQEVGWGKGRPVDSTFQVGSLKGTFSLPKAINTDHLPQSTDQTPSWPNRAVGER